MGQADGKRLESQGSRSARRKTRGSTNNGARLELFAPKRSGGSQDWGGCNPARIQDVILGITRLGGAVTFGLSRDGGAFFVTLLLDDDRTTLWFNGSADLDTELDAVIEKLLILSEPDNAED